MNSIKFKVNGVQHTVGSEVTSDVMLLDYLRTYLELRGTKYMCREGGCGACVVAARPLNAEIVSVNSCLISITSCHGWEITTVEGVGNRAKGYHQLQKTLADNNGTQCGYCSPGWVMAMYSLLKSKTDLTMLEIERSLGSNICRCTGYRPILQAFHKFAKDAPEADRLIDIEDLKICNKTCKNGNEKGCNDDGWCFVENYFDAQVEMELKDGKYWYRVMEVKEIFEVLKRKGDDSYMLVAGNTAKGVYPINEYPRILIDISGVSELKGYKIDQNLIIGAGTTLTDLIEILRTMAQQENFEYLQKLYEHLQKVAHIPVRNLGTIAGNLMIKHQHNEFPSDLYLLLETIDAQLTIGRCNGRETVTMEQFLKIHVNRVVILNVMLPPLTTENKLVTFKIMKRSKNAHAIVNAGFLYKLDKNNIVDKAKIVFGNLSPSFHVAVNTAVYLKGKMLFTNETLSLALKVLEQELVVIEIPPEPSAKFRKQLALALFYKSLLILCPENILDQCYRSGAIKLPESRPLSKAQQIYETDPTLYPLNEPIKKVEALIQCAGEALYTEDLPALPREVFAAFILSSVGSGDIVSIDATKALNQPGVISFYTANDIPGLNSFIPADSNMTSKNEEVLCTGSVKYYNQPVAIIVAETEALAKRAAKLVEVEYKNIITPVIKLQDAIKDSGRVTLYSTTDATDRGDDVFKVIKSGNTIYGQYHFTMENLVSVIHPSEEGLKVYAASHWMDGVHLMLSRALNIDQNRIDVYTRRLGGSFGIKFSRVAQVTVACGLVVQKLNRPCRFIQALTSTMRAVGKKLPCTTSYEAAVNSSGIIQHMDYELYQDNGFDVNEEFSIITSHAYNSCYDKSRWNFKCYNAITDTAKNSWFRAPGNLDCVSMAELLMEQISYELELDPIDVRLLNLDKTKYDEVKIMVDTLKIDAEYNERRAAVDQFNAQNRWKKRGLRISILHWNPDEVTGYDVNMSVYHGDGTVAITHAGTEFGQGINTKSVQICAYILKIPITKIQIKANDTMIAPNSSPTAASVTSQNIGIGTRRCCEELLRRLAPIRQQMNNPTWEELITQASESNVDLQTHGFVTINDVSEYPYTVFGVTIAEVEIDVLTGESQILRVDIMEDVGRSVSPLIDIGQVEGAFIMGVGYWTSEELVYDPKTGELLTNRTWEYKVPLDEDIPQDFRVYLRKNSYSYDGILGAKGVGEPPMCMSVVIALALREAIAAARLESGIPTKEWFQIDGPTTVEAIAVYSATKKEDFKLNAK